jgi:hypothetical protein
MQLLLTLKQDMFTKLFFFKLLFYGLDGAGTGNGTETGIVTCQKLETGTVINSYGSNTGMRDLEA